MSIRHPAAGRRGRRPAGRAHPCRGPGPRGCHRCSSPTRLPERRTRSPAPAPRATGRAARVGEGPRPSPADPVQWQRVLRWLARFHVQHAALRRAGPSDTGLPRCAFKPRRRGADGSRPQREAFTSRHESLAYVLIPGTSLPDFERWPTRIRHVQFSLQASTRVGQRCSCR